MQKFIVEDSFWELFPTASLGVIVAYGMKSTEEIPHSDLEEMSHLLDSANKEADHYLTSNVISENEVVRVWREAFQKFKTKKGTRCSIENLLKRVLKGNPVTPISTSVDIGNVISLTYALSVGGEDLDSFVGDMRLGVTEGGDAFLPLGDEEESPTLPGEVCYRDDIGAVCRCWNWRDGQRTALTDTSKNAFFIIESIDPTREAEVSKALDEFANLVEHYLGATIVAKELVTHQNPEVIIKN